MILLKSQFVILICYNNFFFKGIIYRIYSIVVQSVGGDFEGDQLLEKSPLDVLSSGPSRAPPWRLSSTSKTLIFEKNKNLNSNFDPLCLCHFINKSRKSYFIA